jgi:hypothetical protein
MLCLWGHSWLLHSFFTFNSCDISLLFLFCVACSAWHYTVSFLRTRTISCTIFSFFFLLKYLLEVLHLECNWCSQRCIQWRKKRMNKWIASKTNFLRRKAVVDNCFISSFSPHCSDSRSWPSYFGSTILTLWPQAWPMGNTIRNLKIRKKGK